MYVVSVLYKVFPAAVAYGLVGRFEIHYTPVHESWLNIAEVSISILSRQGVGRCIGNLGLLNREIAAWEKEYNSNRRVVNSDCAKTGFPQITPVNFTFICDVSGKIIE